MIVLNIENFLETIDRGFFN